MLPDDVRHGTTYGYREGCRDACCRRAVADYAMEYRNRRYLQRTNTLMVPIVGTHRRIQALVALGWSLSELSRRAGYDRSMLAQTLRRNTPIRKVTAEHIAKLYDDLSMQLPPQNNAGERYAVTKALTHAGRKGWPPPLAWDDDKIDDPNYSPEFVNKRTETYLTSYDEVVVIRFLEGEFSLPTTYAEKREIARRWTGTRNELARVSGWKVERLLPLLDGAA